MKRALVIGATGFIGLNLVDALLERGVAVRATRRPKSVTVFLRKRRVELVPGDLEDTDSLARAMDGCDAVFVTAGHYPRYSLDRDDALETAVRQIRNACEAAVRAGTPRFVYTSSTGALAHVWPGAASEDDIPPAMPSDSTYRAVKWAMEREVDRFVRERSLPAVTMIPGGCIGPWDVRCGTGGLLVATVHGALPWYVDGIVNLVDAIDVARAHVRAAEIDLAPGSRFCLAGHATTMGALLPLIARRYGGRVPPVRLSAEAAKARADADERAAAEQRGRVDVPRELVDLIVTGQPVSSERAEAALGFRPAPLVESLDRAHEWFRRFRYVPDAAVSREVHA